MKNRLLIAVLSVPIVLIAGFFFTVWKSSREPSLTVVTWTGTYGHAQKSAQMMPFARASGVNVRIAEYDGGTAEIAMAVAEKTYAWDVIDMELPDAVTACREGLLERIDLGRLPSAPDGTPAARDFLPGALGPCWVASIAYSRIVAFDPKRFDGAAPATLADFFDTKKFPGPRAISGSAKYNLEMALLADGVPAKQVYAVLSTPDGIARALRKFDSIRESIVWLGEGDTPAKALADGRAVFAVMLNGDLFDAQIGGRDLGVIWDGQPVEFDVFVVPRGNPRKEMAFDYIRYATGTERLGALASWVPYGPARKSARALVGSNPDLKVAMAPFQPTTGARFASAFPINDEWWRSHGADAETLWRAWLAKKS
jgi:putative spermidine/putrescine transport system substrate-binding protein